MPMFPKLYEIILQMDEFVVEEMKTEILKKGIFSDFELYKLIYLSWLIAHNKIIVPKPYNDIWIDVEYYFEIEDLYFLGEDFNFELIRKKLDLDKIALMVA
ncbi:MAG: hypothetical protein RL065_351 [Bacteroidota bacterium]